MSIGCPIQFFTGSKSLELTAGHWFNVLTLKSKDKASLREKNSTHSASAQACEF